MNKKDLLKRLNAAKSCLHPDIAKIFKGARLDFENKCLISKCGRLVLQWRVRNWPNKPESYHNQQTSRGIVLIVGLNCSKR